MKQVISSKEFLIPHPRRVGIINYRGMFELYLKEVKRFTKIWTQTLLAPAITVILFLVVFTYAFDRPSIGNVPFSDFLVPGLIMMTIVQNAFANTSSSILIAKVQGNIVDVLMPPLGPFELLFAWSLGAITRGLAVGFVAGLIMSFFADIYFHNLWLILYFALTGSMFMAFTGIIGAIWADKFDHMAAVTNFVITPLTFLSGTFYTIDKLPSYLQIISKANPFFYMIDGFRYSFLGKSDGSIIVGLIYLSLLSFIMFMIAYILYKKGYKIKS